MQSIVSDWLKINTSVFFVLDIKQRMCTEHIHGMESLTEYRLASGF